MLYSITQFIVRYHLHKLHACDRLAVYDTERPLFSFDAGWYLNSNVPENIRNSIDRSILKLRLEDQVRRMIGSVVDDSKKLRCGMQKPRIDGIFLGSLFAVVLGPLAVFVLVTLVWGCVIRVAAARLDTQERNSALLD